jgi:hypothetical protein
VALTIALRDGTRYEGRCDITSGEPGNPHPAGAIEAKYFSLAEALWGRSRAQRLLDTIMRIDRCEDLTLLKEDH